MTENERKIAEELYTPEFIEQREEWNGDVFSEAPAALQSIEVHGFMEAVKRLAWTFKKCFARNARITGSLTDAVFSAGDAMVMDFL